MDITLNFYILMNYKDNTGLFIASKLFFPRKNRHTVPLKGFRVPAFALYDIKTK